MNEKSKIFVVFSVIIALILVVVGYNIKVSKYSEKIYNQFVSDLNSTEEKIVFIGREGCSWSQLFRPVFDYYARKYDISYHYISTDSLITRDFNKISDSLDIESENFGTPFVAFVKDGKATDIINGYVDERALLEIFQNHKLVSKEETVALSYLDFSSLKKVVKSKEKSVIVVGQKYCSHCIRFKPVLMKIADEKDAKIYYMNYDEIEEQKELKEYLEQFEAFQGNWGTPLTIVAQNGKVVNTYSGYAEESTYFQFLQANELIKSEVE